MAANRDLVHIPLTESTAPIVFLCAAGLAVAIGGADETVLKRIDANVALHT